MLTMGILLVILIITFVFIMGSGLLFLQMFSQRRTSSKDKLTEQSNVSEKSDNKTRFHWSYIILPLVLLTISIIIVVYFFGKLPDEVAYRFHSDGSPSAWLTRNSIVLWTIIPQLLLALLAVAVAYGTTRIGRMLNQTSTDGINLQTVLVVMSNMVVIPQLILVFAVLNIFSYNAFQVRIGFIWWFILAIIIVSFVLLSIFFVRIIRSTIKLNK